MPTTKDEKQLLLLITYPRTASNLLVKMLNLPQQEQAVSRESGGYYFFPAAVSMNHTKMLHQRRAQWTESQVDELLQKYQSCYEELQQLLDTAGQQGKMMAVTKEHAPFIMSPTALSDFVHGAQVPVEPWRVHVPQRYGDAERRWPDLPPNPSVLPNGFLLLRCTPAFLIRHPALAFPSYYRLMLSFCDDDATKVEEEMVPYISIGCTLGWTRQLYDWYAAAWMALGLEAKGPIVVLDADDMLHDPAVVLLFCTRVGLDPEKAQFHWDPLSREEQSAIDTVSAKTRTTLHLSSGMIKGKSFDGLTIEGEADKWRAEFGELAGNRIEAWVRAAMPDYTYLVGKKLRVGGVGAV